jgi:tetratricopeptide (TPR) repeat protein
MQDLLLSDLSPIGDTLLDPAVRRLVEGAIEKVRGSPKEADGWGILGEILLKHELYSAATKAFHAAERLEPDEPRWPYLDALSRALMGEKNAAIPYLKTAVQLAGDTPDIPRLRLCQFLIELGRYDEAEPHLRALQERYPGHPRATLELARVRLSQNRLDESLELLKACADSPYAARSSAIMLSAVHQRRGDVAAAEAAALKSKSLPVDRPWPDPYQSELARFNVGRSARMEVAMALAAQERFEEALKILGDLTSDYPDEGEPYYVLGSLLNKLQRPAEAERVLRHHLSLSPKSLRGQEELALALLRQNEHAEAAAILESALQINPDFGQVRPYLAYSYAKLGRTEQAIQTYRAALRQSPSRVETYTSLAAILATRGQSQEALELIRQALKLDPSNARAKALLDQLTGGK